MQHTVPFNTPCGWHSSRHRSIKYYGCVKRDITPVAHRLPGYYIRASGILEHGRQWWANPNRSNGQFTPSATFLPLPYNGSYTCMLMASEWEDYANERKPLCVRNPVGAQRSTYRSLAASLQTWYSIVGLIWSITLAHLLELVPCTGGSFQFRWTGNRTNDFNSETQLYRYDYSHQSWHCCCCAWYPERVSDIQIRHATRRKLSRFISQGETMMLLLFPCYRVL